MASLTFVLLLAVGGCSSLSMALPPGSVLFQDDFSREGSGWDRYQDQSYSADYAGGVYQIEVRLPNTDAWANPGLIFGDVHLEVDSLKLSGPNDNVFGIQCRYQDPDNYYFFLISSDGYAGLGVRRAGVTELLSSDTLLPRDAVQQGSSLNHLRADCVGTHLALYVNGVLVAEGESDDWPEGDVGLIAGAYEDPGVVVVFDNFSVTVP